MGIVKYKQSVRDGYLEDLPEAIQSKVISICKIITNKLNERIKDEHYEDLTNSNWAMSCLDEFRTPPTMKGEVGSVRVYKSGKQYKCMIQVTGHFRNHQYGWIEELLHEIIADTFQEVRPDIRRKFDVTLNNESTRGNPNEGFDILLGKLDSEKIWNLFEGRKTKAIKESSDEYTSDERNGRISESLAFYYDHIRGSMDYDDYCEKVSIAQREYPDMIDDGNSLAPYMMESTNDDSKNDDTEEKDVESKKDLVPIYGVLKYTSFRDKRNDGSEKDEYDKDMTRFQSSIKALTRGDNYAHALVSFDDSFRHLYSFGDHGIEDDDIMNDSWKATESIYVCVMFVSKSERDDMKKYVDKLLHHKEETSYAYNNLVKAYAGRPTKIDKRYVCSTFTAYIMMCSNPKNLHRDYSRLRPEDITILPRAFYVINLKDQDDFKSKHDEIVSKVKGILDDSWEEIVDYNNHLPKLMLADRMDKLKLSDKILNWLISKM